MFFDVKLSKQDYHILRTWYRGMLDASGRYGDGEVTLPDEAVIWNKLKNAEKKGDVVPLSKHNIDLILYWAEENIAHTAVNIDEYSLIKKVTGNCRRRHKRLPSVLPQISSVS